MITKRITAVTKLVSQFDDAFILGFDTETRQKYLDTLDIEVLGDLTNLKEQPTIFVVSPLKAKYEYLINDSSVDPWSIFSTHVEGIQNCPDIKLQHKQGVLTHETQEDLPPRVIQDIAHMIISIANKSGSEVFFTQSVASLRYSQAVLTKDALKDRAEIARMVDAKNNSSESE